MIKEPDEVSIHNLEENDLLELPEQSDNSEAPIRLIDFEHQKFKLNEQALELINSIEEEIIVVSIVGKARTGKSYLMNLLLDNLGGKGFDVGSTINSCTKGIWLWSNYRKSQNGNAKIIFIDSEGTSSVDRSTKTYDSKIFTLVVLISSLFIYNTTANIDEQGISELSLAAHLSDSIGKDCSLDFAPKFIWVLRDFTLEKVHPESGQPISNNEYLEICLRRKISGKNSEDNNIIRDNIIKYFKERECVTLPRPVESEEELRNLRSISLDKLKYNFKLEFMQLKDKVFKDSKAKKINGKALTGPILANLISEFVKAINSGSVPDINNAWDYVIEQDVKLNCDKAFEFYKSEIKSLSNQKNENFDNVNLLKRILEIKSEALSKFDFLELNNPDLFMNSDNQNHQKLLQDNRNKLLAAITKIQDKTYEEFKQRNLKSDSDLLKSIFKNLQDVVSKNLNLEFIKNINFADIYSKFKENFKSNESLYTLCKQEKDNFVEFWDPLFYQFKIIPKVELNRLEKKAIILTEEINSLEMHETKLQEMNTVLENRVKFIFNSQIKHLATDNTRKEKEIEFLNERYNNLIQQVRILKRPGTRKPEEEDLFVNELKVEDPSILNECNCNCNIY